MRLAPALVSVLAVTQSAALPSFRTERLDAGQSETAALADLNSDGKLDIVSSESWFEAPSWTKRPIRTIPFTNNYVDNFSDLPVDVDANGHVDLVQIGYFARRLVWLRNPGPAGGAWTETLIDAIGPTEFAFLVDLNNDGKASELLPQFTSQALPLSWYEIANGQWIKRTVSPQGYGHGIGAGDINGDRRTDIVTPRGWLEAPADPRAAGPWTFHQTDWLEPRIAIGPPLSSAGPAPGALGGAAPPLRVEFGFMHVIDINKDGRNDILTTMAHSFGVLWFEQTAAGAWNQHLVDNTWSRAHAAILVDVNTDGQVDLVTGTRFMGRNAAETEPLALYWYEFRPATAAGGQEGPSPPSGGVRWLRHTISAGGEAGAGLQMAAADLDGDGDIDIVSGGKSGLYLARNTASR
jgi:hypothetical protein